MSRENREDLTRSVAYASSEASDNMWTLSPGITFRVNDVSPKGDPFEVIPSFEAINEYLQPPSWLTEQIQRHLSSKLEEQQRLDPQSPELAKLSTHLDSSRELLSIPRIETCSRLSGELCSGLSCHPLVNVIAAAYRQHRPVVLSPDMIWLTICQGISNHVNQHPKRFRNQFVDHSSAKLVEVQHQGFFPGSLENDWSAFVDDLSTECMKSLTPRAQDLFTPRFSTTGPVERMAAQTVMLECVQDYFEYQLTSIICGIPSITLQGTPNDWSTLRQRIDQFDVLELDWWLDALRPILDQFAAASRGEVDLPFWQSIYRQRNAICSHDLVVDHNATGWFAALFPYLADRFGFVTGPNPWLFESENRSRGEWLLYDRGAFKDAEERIRESKLSNARRCHERGLTTRFEYAKIEFQAFADAGLPTHGLYEEQIPCGVSRFRFQWNQVSPEGTEMGQHAMEFLSGFLGMEQDAATLALRPYIGWAVRKASC